jgi:hypothetical protein
MKERKKYGLAIIGVTLLAVIGPIQETKAQASAGKKDSLGDIGSKLSDPTSDIWALFTEFDFTWSKGDLSGDEYKFGSDIIFQPIMPFNITEDWKLLTRPTVPIILSTPVPTSLNPDGTANFKNKSGLGDISLPMMFSPVPKSGSHLSWAAGPTLQFPSHTDDALGTKTWEAGPAVNATYKNEKLVVGALVQYWWSYAEYGGAESTSHGVLLPYFWYNLPKTWQVGFGPSMTYDANASSGNQWNVPIQIGVAKMTEFGKMPVKVQLAVEYSVVSQDDFGQVWNISLNIIPVISSLQKKPFFN